MHQTRYALMTTLLTATILAAPATALHCNGDILALPAGTETLYLDDRSDEAVEIDHWFYLESNGIEGLQSGGDDIFLDGSIPFSFTDPCAHVAPDTLVI